MAAAGDDHRQTNDATRPFVSVCIPARQPGTALSRVLRAVNGDGWPTDRREVIVALDGPDPSLAAEAEALGARVVTLWRPAGSYAARNLAIDALSPSSEYVLFTDSDCIPKVGWT